VAVRPKRQYQKKKAHGKADARGLTGGEIAQKELKAREAAATRERAIVTPDKEDEGQMLVADTPPRPRQVPLPIPVPRSSSVFSYVHLYGYPSIASTP
jgi:hypothetical protein